mmetsp:Transcript_97269/g.275228  ORF Transcript_97269/g.275228 Transcript_97269/m.275228 type:complete len:221 (-) Transcript_97269:70-732(-)
MAIDGHRVANDATFAVGQQERLSFQHLVQLKFPGERVELQLLRGGREVSVSVPVGPLRRLVPAVVYDAPQLYFIYGGLAFVPLTTPYLQEWGEDWRSSAPHELVELALNGLPTLPDEQPVILSRCFPSARTTGYSSLVDRRVLSVNGVAVLNLRQMHSLVLRMHASEPYVVFELQCVGCNALVVVESATADEVRSEILTTHRIPAAASPDLTVPAEPAVK